MLALVGAKSAPRGTPLRGYSLLRSLAPPLPAEPAVPGFGGSSGGWSDVANRVDGDDLFERKIIDTIDPVQADESLPVAPAEGHHNTAPP